MRRLRRSSRWRSTKKVKTTARKRGGEGFDDAAELIETSGGAADFADLERVFGSSADGLLRGFAGRLECGGGGGVDDAEFVADVLEFVLRRGRWRSCWGVKGLAAFAVMLSR